MPAALLVVADGTASTPPHALHAPRKTLPRHHAYFYHGLLAVAAASSARVYRPCHPDRTALDRALAHYFERFLLVYDQRSQRAHGHLRGCVEPAVHRYLTDGQSQSYTFDTRACARWASASDCSSSSACATWNLRADAF